MISIKMPNPDKLFDGLDKRSLQLVKVRAQNKLAAKAKTLASRVAREKWTVKAGALRNAIRVSRASTADPSAELVISGRRINIAQFQISPSTPDSKRQRRLPGTKVKLLRGESGKPWKHAFTGRTKRGLGVFRRNLGKWIVHNGRRMQAWIQQAGPDPVAIIGHESVYSSIRQLVHDESEVIYKRELAFELSRATATVRIG